MKKMSAVASTPPRGKEPAARIYWKRARAYGDFRAWVDWGGRLEALKEEGAEHATPSPVAASILFGQRLAELQRLRVERPFGLQPEEEEDPYDRFAPFVAYHLHRKRIAKDSKEPSEWLNQVQDWLTHAATYFAERDVVYLRHITMRDVQDWMDEITIRPPSGRAVLPHSPAPLTRPLRVRARPSHRDAGRARRIAGPSPRVSPPACYGR